MSSTRLSEQRHGGRSFVYRFHQPLARTVATGLAAFQLGLLLFLTL